MRKKSYSVNPENKGERLDIFVSLKSGLTRSNIQRLIKDGLLLVNSLSEKAGYRIKGGDRIKLTIPDKPVTSLIPEDIPLDVIREDSHIIVVNKAQGMVIYPSSGHRSGTLMNAVAAKCKSLASIGAPLRPGVVHRIDKDTSGLIVIAKNDSTYLHLTKQFKNREVEKQYTALIYGSPKKDRGEISAAIGRSVSDRKRMSTKTRKGREAITQFEVIKRFKTASLIKVKLVTGRTHQIRVHFAASGHPVLGDRTYGKKTVIKFAQKTISFTRQMLHAYSLKFKHPGTDKLIELTAPLPEDMERAIKELAQHSSI